MDSKFLKNGYLPIFSEGENEYFYKLEQIISTVVDIDLAYIASYNYGTAIKKKKLLRVIAESAPFKPNISALSNKLDISCDRILEYPEVRNLRETFLLSQFLNAGYEVHEPQHGDFLVKGITIEVGGKN